jgi:hypothetical protein
MNQIVYDVCTPACVAQEDGLSGDSFSLYGDQDV